MIQNEIQKFMALAPLIMPTLIRNESATETDVTEDYGIMYFSFGEKLPIGIVMDSCDGDMELLMLYHACSEKNPKLQHTCFFPVPKPSGMMFKINIVTDDKGYADSLSVTVYEDADVWEQFLENDLTAHTKGYTFTEATKQNDLLSLFMNQM